MSTEDEKKIAQRLGELAFMLQQIVSHADQPAMDDAQFRKFARENAQHVLDNSEVGKP